MKGKAEELITSIIWVKSPILKGDRNEEDTEKTIENHYVQKNLSCKERPKKISAFEFREEMDSKHHSRVIAERPLRYTCSSKTSRKGGTIKIRTNSNWPNDVLFTQCGVTQWNLHPLNVIKTAFSRGFKKDWHCTIIKSLYQNVQYLSSCADEHKPAPGWMESERYVLHIFP